MNWVGNCYGNTINSMTCLGFFGYKNFVVDYNRDMDELNKRVIQHAYSKGNTSWLKTLEHHSSSQCTTHFLPLGTSGDIYQVLYLITCSMYKQGHSTITCFEKYIESPDDLDEILSWTTRVFMNWGFNLTQYLNI